MKKHIILSIAIALMLIAVPIVSLAADDKKSDESTKDKGQTKEILMNMYYDVLSKYKASVTDNALCKKSLATAVAAQKLAGGTASSTLLLTGAIAGGSNASSTVVVLNWRAVNTPALNISLINLGSSEITLVASSTPNDGNESFGIPTTIASGTYGILLQSSINTSISYSYRKVVITSNGSSTVNVKPFVAGIPQIVIPKATTLIDPAILRQQGDAQYKQSIAGQKKDDSKDGNKDDKKSKSCDTVKFLLLGPAGCI